MLNKAPKGKTEPSPSQELELEQYGVWVKAEPQDVSDEADTDREILDAEPLDNADALLLSDEEEDLLGTIDSTSEAFELEALPSPDEFDLELELPETDDTNAEPDLPDTASASAFSELDSSVIEDTVIDIALDDLDYEKEPSRPEPVSSLKETRVPDTSAFSTTEINIEDFGFSDDNSLSGSPSLEDSSFMEPLEATAGSSLQPDQPGEDDFETLDIDLQFDDTIPAVETSEASDTFERSDGSGPESEFESVEIDSIGVVEPHAAPGAKAGTPQARTVNAPDTATSLDSFIDDDDFSPASMIPDLEIESVSLGSEPSGFDDIEAVSADLGARDAGPSSDLLQKIALELSSIKEELVSLRSQLGSLKAAGPAVQDIEPDIVEETADDNIPGGFFDDEDDDTIALTGDELDNILNTADFTEEAASDDPLLESVPKEQLELSPEIELLPEDGNYQPATEPGIDTIELPVVDRTEEEAEAMDPDSGVTPLTDLAEDTSFLESADDAGFDSLNEMPLEDLPLIEPDSSDLDLIIDSAFGAEEEDLPALESGDEAETLEPELILDIDSEAQPVISTVDTFPVSLDEFEEEAELEEYLEPEDLGGLELQSGDSELGDLEEVVLEEEPTLDVLEDLDSIEHVDDEASNASVPLVYHPDELATSLDDSLFVEPAVASESLPADDELLPELEEDLEMLDSVEPAFENLDGVLPEVEPEPAAPAMEEPAQAPVAPRAGAAPAATQPEPVLAPPPDKLKNDVKSVLLYLDQLLASLPEEKIEEFASSEYYDTYKRLFDDLGLL